MNPPPNRAAGPESPADSNSEDDKLSPQQKGRPKCLFNSRFRQSTSTAPSASAVVVAGGGGGGGGGGGNHVRPPGGYYSGSMAVVNTIMDHHPGTSQSEAEEMAANPNASPVYSDEGADPYSGYAGGDPDGR